MTLLTAGFSLAVHVVAQFLAGATADQPIPKAVAVSPADRLPAEEADVYPLDDLPRRVSEQGKIACPKVDLVRYKGRHLKLHSPVRVFAGFAPRLEKFEQVVQQLALEVYGRPARLTRHIGTLNCRRIRLWPTYLSEHGIANAIDVAGFDFGPAKKSDKLPAGLPKALRKGFQVRVKAHWTATDPVGAVHNHFLRTLATRLIERPDIFRVLLGPAYPGHHDHFHFDCAPWRLVEIFEASTQ